MSLSPVERNSHSSEESGKQPDSIPKGYLALGGGVSIIVTPIMMTIGAVGFFYTIIRGIGEKLHLSYVKYQIKEWESLKGKCSELNPNNSKEKIETIIFQLTKSKEAQEKRIQTLKHDLAASLFALIPFVGSLAIAAFFSQYINPDATNRSIQSVKMIAEGQKAFVRKLFFPLQGNPNIEEASYFKGLQAKGGEKIKIDVDRGEGQSTKLNIVALPPTPGQKIDFSKPTMVLFHGNIMTLKDMEDRADYYTTLGMNVVFATMAGYPGSGDSETLTSEISIYQDTHAIMNHLKSQGATNIGVHGLSIGGAMAFAAAELHPNVVKLVVADQTFDEARNVGVNFINNCNEGFKKHAKKLIPKSLVRRAVEVGFPKEKVVPGVQKPDGNSYVTDGLNNKRKVDVLGKECQLFAIKASKDFMMGRNGNLTEGFKDNFSDDLLKVRYGDESTERSDNIAEIPGMHCEWFTPSNDGRRKLYNQISVLKSKARKDKAR